MARPSSSSRSCSPSCCSASVSRRAAQTAADAAAWAGAVVLHGGGTAADAASAARVEADRNGFTADAATTIAIASPPATGTYAGDPGSIEVTITRQVAARFFLGSRPVTARGVAAATRSGTGEGVLVLRATGSDALTVGSGTLRVTGSGIHVNSNNGSAIDIGSGGIISTYTRVRGGVAPGDDGKIAPAAETGAALVADPFATLAGPPTAGLPVRSLVPYDVTSSRTLEPGIYVGGIRVRNNGTVAMFEPGIYVLRWSAGGFGLTVNNNAQVRMATPTSGVLLFNTYSAYPTPPFGAQTCGPVDLNSTGQITIRPLAVGTYAGISVYQDRACTTTMQFRGGGAWTLNGTIYLPSAAFSLGGSSGVAQNIQLVANTVALSGASSITINYDASLVAGGRIPALVE